MSDDKFKPGDLVCLKSGGPTMTIQYCSTSTKMYICYWFERDALHKRDIPEVCLKEAVILDRSYPICRTLQEIRKYRIWDI